MIAAIATVAILARVKTLWFLLPIVYCFSIINLILQALLPEIWVYHLSQNTSLLFHIALSLFAYSVCFIAMLYAIQLRWIDNSLKSKKLTFSPVVPPLMTVEKHFFRSLFSGQILLTLTLISGSIQLIDFFSAHNIPKAIFFIFSLVCFRHSVIWTLEIILARKKNDYLYNFRYDPAHCRLFRQSCYFRVIKCLGIIVISKNIMALWK